MLAMIGKETVKKYLVPKAVAKLGVVEFTEIVMGAGAAKWAFDKVEELVVKGKDSLIEKQKAKLEEKKAELEAQKEQLETDTAAEEETGEVEEVVEKPKASKNKKKK